MPRAASAATICSTSASVWRLPRSCMVIRHRSTYSSPVFLKPLSMASLSLPVIQPGDAADTHYKDVYSPEQKGLRYFRLLKASYPTLEEGLRTYVRAYLACGAFVDEQVGKVVEAVEGSGLRDNTIILVTSDHGYNLGQKDYLFKNSLWEESGRVPLIIRAPGWVPGKVEAPLTLMDLTPTLLELGGVDLGALPYLKGVSLSGVVHGGLLADRLQVFGRPLYGPEQWGVRVGDQKYITRTGKESIYDLHLDPGEMKDLVKEEGPAILPVFRDAMADGLGWPAGVVFRVVPNRGGHNKDLSVDLVVPGGIRGAWVGNDATLKSAASVDVERGRIGLSMRK